MAKKENTLKEVAQGGLISVIAISLFVGGVVGMARAMDKMDHKRAEKLGVEYKDLPYYTRDLFETAHIL